MVYFDDKTNSPDLAPSPKVFLSVDTALNFFHGSNSASLEGVIKNGLRPFGELTDVPFSGTLDTGISNQGINNYSISAVKAELAPRAYDYTTSKLEGWNPYVHQKFNSELTENLNKVLKERAQLESQINDGSSSFDTDQGVLKHFDSEISRINKHLDLEQRRIAAWDNLTEEQRDLIKNPFPVLYGIKHEGESAPVRSSVSGERGLPMVDPQNIIIFVLPEHKEKVEGLTRALGSQIPVKSIYEINSNLATPEEWIKNDLKYIQMQYDRAKQDRLLYSEQTNERVKGIELLKNKSPLPGNAESTLILMLEDPTLSIRMTAAAALGDIGGIESFRHLKSMAPINPFLKEVIEDSIFKIRIKQDTEYKSRTGNL